MRCNTNSFINTFASDKEKMTMNGFSRSTRVAAGRRYGVVPVITLGLFCLALMAGRPASAQFGGWAPTQVYAAGYYPSVCWSSRAVEVHQGAPGTLWYRIDDVPVYNGPAGGLWDGSVTWSASSQYDAGYFPSVSSDGSNNVVEVHQGVTPDTLWYHTGVLSNGKIDWSQVTYEFGAGYFPCVSIDGSCVVEVHEVFGQGGLPATLWYHTGVLSNGKITWSAAVEYDTGSFPSVSVNGNEVIEVHQGATPGTLWYRTGVLSNGKITWSAAVEYGTGYFPSVSIDRISYQIFEVHQGMQAGLWYHWGELNGSATEYSSTGYFPRVAFINGSLIEVNMDAADEALSYSTGYIVPKIE
jgi:hypothetical protein